MARIIMLICAMSVFAMAYAETFSYRFNSTPLPKAIQKIMENHPDLDINFIYNELENYNTSATVDADNAYDALRQAVGLNPVTVVKAKNTYYVEALQHGKYIYTGRAIGSDDEPVAAATVSFAWDWDRLQFGDMVDTPTTPKASLALQYAPDDNNSLSFSATYESWLPSPSFKSDKIIEATPLMKYTGNPNLVPSKSYDFDFTYTWIPNNSFSLSAFAWAWIVGDRYVYDYEASSSGILRTIKQPMGSFAQGTYGVSGSAGFFNRSLVFSGRIGQLLNHNGMPYDVNHSYINWYARARYYLGNWNFTLTYSSDNASADGCMNGLWAYGKSDWYITVGWSNSHWNLRGDIFNFTRWNYRNDHFVMRSKYYDTDEIRLGGKSRAFIQLAATYTFGFGKKVKRDDEPSVSGSASSGILK